MKNIILLSICILAYTINAQQWAWEKSFIGGSTSKVKKTAVDNFGNVFVLGYVYASNVYESNTIDSGIYVAKFQSNGAFLWAKNIPNALNEDPSAANVSMDIDASGNVLILGSYRDSLFFSPHTIYANGDQDIFLLKINTIGQSVWLKSFGGNLKDIGSAIAIDSSDIYITGTISGNTTFSPLILNDTTTNVHFIARIDPGGLCLWVVKSGFEDSKAIDISIGENGNIYTAGIFHCPAACTNYVNKFSAAGTLLLSKIDGDSYIKATDILTKGDQIYIINYYVDHYGHAWTELIKYDTQLNYKWQRGIGGLYYNYWCYDYQIGNDKSVYLWADYGYEFPANDSVKIGSIWIQVNHQQDRNAAIVRMDSNGVSQHASPYYTKNGYWSERAKIAVDNYNNCYVACALVKIDTLTFDSDTINCYQKGYIAKLSNINISVNSVEHPKLASIDVFPNPSSGIFTVKLEKKNVEAFISVYDLLGNCLLNKNCRNDSNFHIDLSDQSKGIYFMEIVSDGKRSMNKIVLQ